MIDRVKFQIENPDNAIEELILSGMITQTDFLKRIAARINIDYFRSMEVRILISWIMEYFKNHGEAPGKEIEVIYRIESQQDDPLQKKKLGSLITIALTQFGESFNIEYVLPKALQYFRKQSLTLAMEMTRHYLGKDDLEEAELSYYKYKEVAQGISYYPNPFSDEAIRLWWEYTDEELLRFPGYLGKYLAPICRGQLIGVMGPPKRGKTTLLTEFACIALMHKLKVVFFSLEMNRNKINQKIMTRIAGRPKFPEKYQDLRIPVMDCLKNQTGECRYPQRNNKINLLGEDGKIMGYDPKLDGRYKPCTYCLKKGSDDYVFAVWYQTKRYQHATMKDFQNIRDDFKQIFGGNNLIVEAYPIGTFSCKDLENRLTLLEQEKKIFFDCICIDYADIMKKEDRRERRLEIGSIWEQLAALSQKKNCLVVTASQTNRAATNKADLTMEDLAEDYSKAMIADMFLAINQTSQEKDNSILRIATVLHRHRGFSLHHQCRVIQAPEIGQFSLGSCGAARKLTR